MSACQLKSRMEIDLARPPLEGLAAPLRLAHVLSGVPGRPMNRLLRVAVTPARQEGADWELQVHAWAWQWAQANRASALPLSARSSAESMGGTSGGVGSSSSPECLAPLLAGDHGIVDDRRLSAWRVHNSSIRLSSIVCDAWEVSDGTRLSGLSRGRPQLHVRASQLHVRLLIQRIGLGQQRVVRLKSSKRVFQLKPSPLLPLDVRPAVRTWRPITFDHALKRRNTIRQSRERRSKFAYLLARGSRFDPRAMRRGQI